ncbi:cysteine--tRNA ligase [Sphingomonas aerolata]
MTTHALTLYNSLTRRLEPFAPIDPANVGLYSCGPTVYNYAHIGNLRAYVFTDTLSRTLTWKGFGLTHIVNITDVGHLTSDADAGDDKMEAAARASGQDIWAIARHYTEAFKRNLIDLHIRTPTRFPLATDHIAEMIAFAEAIAPEHCYRLEDGLYFDTSTVPDYGRLAWSNDDAGESRIDPVAGKRHPQDFAIWRTSAPGEMRQMEWDSPWGRGAPGWHLECSVMSQKYLGPQFDIHTGGIDHREIHHPNEIAQNQARCGCADTGANLWMHNNFLVERSGKMSKSGGKFTTLQTLIDRGFHPLAYRLMCLQAQYRSELEFSWDNLAAATTRLKRLALTVQALRDRAASSDPAKPAADTVRTLLAGYRDRTRHRGMRTTSRRRAPCRSSTNCSRTSGCRPPTDSARWPISMRCWDSISQPCAARICASGRPRPRSTPQPSTNALPSAAPRGLRRTSRGRTRSATTSPTPGSR